MADSTIPLADVGEKKLYLIVSKESKHVYTETVTRSPHSAKCVLVTSDVVNAARLKELIEANNKNQEVEVYEGYFVPERKL